MFVAALTQSGHLYVFSFSLSRVENWKEISKAQKGGKILLDEAGNERLMDLVDYQYNRKYKQLLQQYEYVPKYPTQADEKRKAREAKKKGETLQKILRLLRRSSHLVQLQLKRSPTQVITSTVWWLSTQT